MDYTYNPTVARECDDCGTACTIEMLTPQKRLIDAPAVWACPKCVADRDSHAGICQCTIDRRWTLPARVLDAPPSARRELLGLEPEGGT